MIEEWAVSVGFCINKTKTELYMIVGKQEKHTALKVREGDIKFVEDFK